MLPQNHMFPQGKCAYPPEKLITEETANVCSKTQREQDSPEPGFCGVKIAAKGGFEAWLLSVFFEWIKSMLPRVSAHSQTGTVVGFPTGECPC